MWIGESVNFNAQRNAVVPFSISVYDIEDNIIDLTGYTISCPIAEAEGQTPIVTLSATEFEPTLGKFNISIDGADFDAVPGATEQVTLAYNVLATDVNMDSFVLLRGSIFLSPGV